MKDRGFEDRMSGMRLALTIAEKEGVEGLKKECLRRNITKFPTHISKAECQKMWDELCANMYNNITATLLYCLYDAFNFNKEDIQRLMDEYQKNVLNVLDMDYMGEHYIRLEDYAVELVEKYGVDLDINRIAVCQDYHDESGKNENYHMAKIDRIIEILEQNNYIAAATFLRKKVEQI